MKKFLLPFLAVILAACGTTGTPPQQDGAGVGDGSVQTIDTRGMSGTDLGVLTDPSSILSRRSVHFDFDSFIVRADDRPLLEAHANFLNKNRQMKVLLQGNTDERGSREYNLALGQKRADAVKQVLLLLGVSEAQIESVSLGKEKPRCLQASETCYAENRRVDILYTGEF